MNCTWLSSRWKRSRPLAGTELSWTSWNTHTFTTWRCSQLVHVNEVVTCHTAQFVRPGEADRFGVRLTAQNLPPGVCRSWDLAISLLANQGSPPRRKLKHPRVRPSTALEYTLCGQQGVAS